MTPTTFIDTVLLKVASRCNLDCTYCYVYHLGDDGWQNQPKLLPFEVETAVVDQLRDLASAQERGFSVVLHGGEPLMLGAKRLDLLFSRLRNGLPSTCGLHIQTNGVLLSQSILDICADHQVGISVSIDGPESIHDHFRIDRRGRPSHSRVMEAVERMRQHPQGSALFSGVLAVVDPASDAKEVYQFLKSTGAPSIDFLYRDGNHSTLPFGKSSFYSTEYGDWMCHILDVYLRDPEPPRIRFLDDMLRLLLGGAGRKEGVGLTDFGIVVIETDGTINKNDTLKSAYKAADQFSHSWSILRDRLTEVVRLPEFHSYHNAQRPTCDICRKCSELEVCGGGMPAHRWSEERSFDNPSVFCWDQQALIRHMRLWISKKAAA